MSTPLTDRITGLTAQANAVTGASDTTLTDAVGRLIGGYARGIDVVVSEDTFTNVKDLVEYLFTAINGESGKAYYAVLTNAVTPNLYQQMYSINFAKKNENYLACGMRLYADGTFYRAVEDNAVKVTVGDIYTVYSL